MNDPIRTILNEHGKLSVDAMTLADDADLYQAGMRSHASVNVMLALEGHLDRSSPTTCSSAACSRAPPPPARRSTRCWRSEG